MEGSNAPLHPPDDPPPLSHDGLSERLPKAARGSAGEAGGALPRTPPGDIVIAIRTLNPVTWMIWAGSAGCVALLARNPFYLLLIGAAGVAVRWRATGQRPTAGTLRLLVGLMAFPTLLNFVFSRAGFEINADVYFILQRSHGCFGNDAEDHESLENNERQDHHENGGGRKQTVAPKALEAVFYYSKNSRYHFSTSAYLVLADLVIPHNLPVL